MYTSTTDSFLKKAKEKFASHYITRSDPIIYRIGNKLLAMKQLFTHILLKTNKFN